MTQEQMGRAAELAAFFLRDDRTSEGSAQPTGSGWADREEEEAVNHDGPYYTDPATGICRYCDGRHPIPSVPLRGSRDCDGRHPVEGAA